MGNLLKSYSYRLLIRGSLVQAHPEALKNERVTQVTLFCFCPPEQILVSNTRYLGSPYHLISWTSRERKEDVIREKSEHHRRCGHQSVFL